MSELFSWLITALVVVLVLSFVYYLASLRALPTDGRPRTRSYDRFGRLIGETENPDYHENPGELSENNPDIGPSPGPRQAH